jgi:hypothetical protein
VTSLAAVPDLVEYRQNRDGQSGPDARTPGASQRALLGRSDAEKQAVVIPALPRPPLVAVPDILLPDGTVHPGPLTGAQAPRFWTAPPRHREKDPDCRKCRDRSYRGGCGNYAAEELLDWCPHYGYELDPWQEWWLTEECGTKPDGRWTAFEAVGICSRQNGKNVNLEVRELGGLYVFGESLIIHTAHEFKAAAEHFRRVRDTISSYDALSRRVKRVMTSHGDEAIELKSLPTLIFGPGGRQVRRNIGGRLRFLARSRGSGRSFTADCVVYDEAMFLSDEQVGASMPTMSAVANPQMIYTASAGYHDSVQLAMVRRRIFRHDASLMGAEWSIDPHTDTCPRDEVLGRKTNRYIICDKHDDRDDPRSWAKANPAFNARISYEHIAKEFKSMTAAAFDRERLGVGDWPEEEESWSVVSEEAWARCAMPKPGGATRPLAFAVDVNPEMTVATIAAAWERPDPPQIVAVPTDARGNPVKNYRPPRPDWRTVLEIPRGCSKEGTNWVVARLAELKKEWRPVAICIPRNGPAAGLADAAEQAGIEILTATSGDEAAAFAQIVTGIRDRKVIHMGRELAPSLWQAIASAETREIGDGGRGWSRRTSDADITPIVAATLANWALGKKRRSYDIMKSFA